VPSLPGVAPVSPAVVGHERSYIGIARSRSGSWVITSPAWLPAQAMTVRVPGTGTPVWGDWDGDGLATPGRYSNGTWSEASHRVGTATPTPVASFGGIAGDIPVTGDIDGDRRTDRGIFRQTGEFHWLLATGQRLRIPFGAAGDAPVVGDWNGDGRDDLAVVRSAQWFLRIPLGTPLPPGLPDRVVVEEVADHRLARFTLGGPADVPLAGDWDGDGVDTPALVRESSRWLTANTWGRLDRLSVTIRRVGAGLIPIAVPSPADAVTGRCPSASPALVRNQAAAAALVVPPRPLSAPTIPSDGPTVDGWALVRDALRDQSRYLVRSDVTGRLSGVRRQPYFDVLATDWRATSYSVRRVGNAAFAVAVARATGAPPGAQAASRARPRATSCRGRGARPPRRAQLRCRRSRGSWRANARPPQEAKASRSCQAWTGQIARDSPSVLTASSCGNRRFQDCAEARTDLSSRAVCEGEPDISAARSRGDRWSSRVRASGASARRARRRLRRP